MKKILIILLLALSLAAQNFEQFLEEALQNSPYLKANSLRVQESDAKASLIRRYENPSLELEASNFSPDIGEDETGYRVALLQPVRLWGIADARDTLAQAQKSKAQNLTKLNRANFVVALSSSFSEYKSKIAAEELAKEEYLISSKIVSISKERFENGTIAKVKYMQAKLDQKRVQNRLDEMKLSRVEAYYKLLALAGAKEEIDLKNDYEFLLAKKDFNSLDIAYSKSQNKEALANAKLNTNKVEWIDLYGEFEQESDQQILRVGVNIPLAIFNRKKEEKQIASLRAKKANLLTNNLVNIRAMKLREIQKSLHFVYKLQASTEELLKSQEELLKMYEESYKVANIDLIELQIIKNQMIQTKEKIIAITLLKEQKIIQHNFLRGEYNDK
jgi:cobalt-zinc-cadmium efflux system outer membrane protein